MTAMRLALADHQLIGGLFFAKKVASTRHELEAKPP
jgi:hypothetical protein